MLTALGDLSTKVYNELNRDKYFEPDVRSHSAFDSLDCSTLLQSALSKVKKVLVGQQKLEDRQPGGKRKHPEAGAEVSAMSADAKQRRTTIEGCVT